MNDFKPASHVIFNVCLMPDETSPEGAQFSQSVVDVSGKLNALTPSEYLVNNRPQASIDSWAHCSVMHVRVPNDLNTIATVAHALKTAVGESITLDIGELSVVDNSAFLLDALMRGDVAHAFRPSDMMWILVNRNQDLLKLQEQIVGALIKGLGSEEGLITPRGAGYRPHFTCWIKFKGHSSNLPELRAERLSKPVPCRVRLGNSGPIGQVRNFVDKAEKLAELVAIPLEA